MVSLSFHTLERYEPRQKDCSIYEFTILPGGLPYGYDEFIDKVLCHFEPCFSRIASLRWFVTITIGFILRSDKLGVTSVIRDPALSPDCYASMIHFFRADSWSLDNVCLHWFSALKKYAPLYKEGSFFVLTGNGVKQSKEGLRMPRLKHYRKKGELCPLEQAVKETAYTDSMC